MQKDLLSKLMAGGLSAAVVLVWWAAYFPAQGVTTWLTRGLAMTLLYELLFLSFVPLERHLWNSRPGRALIGRVEHWHERLLHAPDRRRVHGSVALACVATLVPVLLLSAGARRDPRASSARPTVRQVTINRETVVRTPVQQVVVQKTITAPSPAAVGPRTRVVHTSTTRTVVLAITTAPAPSPPPTTPSAGATAPAMASPPATTPATTTSSGAATSTAPSPAGH